MSLGEMGLGRETGFGGWGLGEGDGFGVKMGWTGIRVGEGDGFKKGGDGTAR